MERPIEWSKDKPKTLEFDFNRKNEKQILIEKNQRLQNENKLLRENLDEKRWLPVTAIFLVGIMVGLLIGLIVTQDVNASLLML